MTDLPIEIYQYIVNYLDGCTLLEFSLVSRHCNLLTRNENVWKKRCFDEFNISSKIGFRRRTWKKLYLSLIDPTVYIWNESNRSLRSRSMNFIHHSQPWKAESLEGKRISQIELVSKYIYVLNQSGRIWYCTKREIPDITFKQLGDQTTQDIKFESISTGDFYSIGLARDGTVWHWKNPKRLFKINGVNAQVIQVTANNAHSTMLTNQGEIWFASPPTLNGGRDAVFGVRLEDKIIQSISLDNHILVLTISGRVLLINTLYYEDFAKSPDDFIVDLVHYSGASERSITGNYEDFAVCTQDKILFGHIGSNADSMPIIHSDVDKLSVRKISFGKQCYAVINEDVGGMIFTRLSKNTPDNSESVHLFYEHLYAFENKYILSVSFGLKRCMALAIDKY